MQLPVHDPNHPTLRPVVEVRALAVIIQENLAQLRDREAAAAGIDPDKHDIAVPHPDRDCLDDALVAFGNCEPYGLMVDHRSSSMGACLNEPRAQSERAREEGTEAPRHDGTEVRGNDNATLSQSSRHHQLCDSSDSGSAGASPSRCDQAVGLAGTLPSRCGYVANHGVAPEALHACLHEVWGQYCLTCWLFDLRKDVAQSNLASRLEHIEMHCETALEAKHAEVHALAWRLAFERRRRSDQQYVSSTRFAEDEYLASNIPAIALGEPADRASDIQLVLAAHEHAGMLAVLRWVMDIRRQWGDPKLTALADHPFDLS